MNDLIDRQKAIEAICRDFEIPGRVNGKTLLGFYAKVVMERLKRLPSAQPERDIPVKPIETTDRAWGIHIRQAVCPKCDSYLYNVVFIGVGKRITYCEHCGQAIDWKGWEEDE